MSGIYIPGMEMPKSCFYCPFREKVNPDDYVCMVLNKEFEETFSLIAGKRHKNCPLIHVPEHGDLIEKHDVFKLISAFPAVDKLLPVEFMQALYNLRTIIPADKEETDMTLDKNKAFDYKIGGAMNGIANVFRR